MLGRLPVVRTDSEAGRRLMIEAFGVTVEVTADPQHLEAIRPILPPGGRRVTIRPDAGRFELISSKHGLLEVICDGESVSSLPVDLEVAFGILDAQMRMHIALHAPDHVFVHAGAVGVGGQAIVLPGKSFAGKTTLAAALVRAGAEYCSDEYAALDADGRVHPYPKPLSVRTGGLVAEDRRSRASAAPPRIGRCPSDSSSSPSTDTARCGPRGRAARARARSSCSSTRFRLAPGPSRRWSPSGGPPPML